MKSYTDIEQSKKLAEILPLESADMYYFLDPTPAGNIYHLTLQRVDVGIKNLPHYDEGDIPCWGLAALLSILPYPSLHKIFAGWRCDSYDKKGQTCKLGKNAGNPIDACYEMIIHLNELNLL